MEIHSVRDGLVIGISAFEWSNRDLLRGSIVREGLRWYRQSEGTYLALRSSGADEASFSE
jgi:hypothetical protein